MLNQKCIQAIFCYTLIIFGFLNVYAQNSIFEWIQHAGGNSNERGTAIELDSFGNVYCTGEISDSTWFADTSFVANFADIYLAKYSNDGDMQWIRLCGGTGLDRGLDMKVDQNNDIIVTGFFSGTASFGDSSLSSAGGHDLFIAKYNSNGSFQWVVHGRGIGHDEGLCIATDSNNNIFVGGFFRSSIQLGTFNLLTGSYETAFIAKLSPSGVVLWAEQAVMQDPGESVTNDIICDNNGNVIFTGFFDYTATFQDTTLFAFDDSDDVFVAKYNTNGNKIWAHQAGGDYEDRGNAIDIDEVDNIYLTGDFRHLATFGNFNLISTDNNADLFFCKLDPFGNFLWIKQGSGVQTDSPLSIFYHQQHGVAISGGYSADFTIGDSTFNSGATEDIFLAVFTATGTFKYALSIGDNGDDSGYDVYLNNDNHAFMIGKFEESILFGDSLLVSHSLADIFITKINLSSLTVVKKPKVDTSPTHFSLAQNYPNPFNPSTVISWHLAVRSPVILTLYNLKGQLLAVLMDEILDAGEHQVKLNCHELASGIYFYRLTVGQYVETKKMVVMK